MRRELIDPDTHKMKWSFGLLTFGLLLVDVRAQAPCSMASTITVTLDEGNVTANQILTSSSPYQALLPVTGTLGAANGITLVMTNDNPFTANPNNTFKIEDAGTGTRIRLITSVDRDGPGFTNLDDTEIISFQLKCTSNADTSTTAYATVNVNIRDVNDNSPQFINTPYSVSVEEFTPVGATIYRQLSALDKDTGLAATIDYTITTGDGSVRDGSRKFIFISTRFPTLIINQSLDFEPMYALGQTTYVMTVIATDLGTPPLSSVAQVNVTVTDSDDMAPAFVYANCLFSGIYCVDPRYSTSVVSGLVTNPLVIYPLVGFTRQTPSTIRAVDRDTLRSPLTFRIVGTSPVGYETYFSLAGSGPVSSGDKDIYTATLIQLKQITRSSTLTRVEVYILATQANGKYEERATVSVEIDVPNNSPPTVTTATGVNTGYIYENSHLGQNVLDGTTSLAKPLQLIVTDPDDNISGQKTTFSFSATGTGLFNIDSNGYIYLASGNLDYETTKSATINVRVTEINTAEKRSTNVTVTILVLDLNDNDPVFTSTGAAHVSVLEGDYTLSFRLLAQVDATDADFGVNGLLKYSIMSTEPAVPSGFFTINANTGDVSLSGHVTYPSYYVVVVKASDSAVSPDAVRSATKNLYVNVTSAGNNAPQIPSTLYTITISEGTASGTSIFTVPIPFGNVSYSIIGDKSSKEYFAISPSTGIITLSRSVVNQDGTIYNIIVQAQDGGIPPRTDVAVIQVDVKDDQVFFTQTLYTSTIPEGIATAFIVNVKKNPNIIASDFTYQFLLEETSSLFSINRTSGIITTAIALDYESTKFYEFKILATYVNNTRIQYATAAVLVTVQDVNDNSPVLTLSTNTLNVARDAGINILLTAANATDRDAPGTANSEIEYTIASVIPYSGLSLFSIDRVMGHLVNVQSFTKEPNSYQYQITIRASDKGTPVQSSTSLFLLNIIATASEAAKTSDNSNILLIIAACEGAALVIVLSLVVIMIIQTKCRRFHSSDGSNVNDQRISATGRTETEVQNGHLEPIRAVSSVMAQHTDIYDVVAEASRYDELSRNRINMPYDIIQLDAGV